VLFKHNRVRVKEKKEGQQLSKIGMNDEIEEGEGAPGDKLGDLGCVDGPLDYVLWIECEIYKVAS
jgi:hypothetical protein